MAKKAVVLREAGGLGDIIQLGSACDLLQEQGHEVSLHTLQDPAIVELAKGLKGVDSVVSMGVHGPSRRPRDITRYNSYKYLSGCVEAIKGADKFVDAWCPCVSHELLHAQSGSLPKLSRAQAFADSAGFPPEVVKPARINREVLMAGNGGFADTIRGRFGEDWILVHLKAREPTRTVPDEVAFALLYLLAQKYTVVVFAYPENQWGSMMEIDNVHWFTAPRGTTESIRALHAAFALCEQAKAAIVVDSFMLHVSQCVGTPAILLSGPTDPVPLTAHYDNVHWVEREKAPCEACYYQSNRGFSAICRSKGCFHMTRFSMSKLMAKVEEVVG